VYLLLILLGLILAAAATFLLAARHPSNRGPSPATGALLDLATAASFVLIVVATIPKTPWGAHPEHGRVFLFPFQELIKETQEDNPALGSAIGEMMINVLLFFPLGILVPMRWPLWVDAKRLLLGAALASLGIETIQFALELGRTSSTTDVLLNTAGAGVGFLVLVLLKRRSSWAGHPPGVSSGDRESGQPGAPDPHGGRRSR
jgi:glycopeptide antibiotics resistance protein